MARILSILTALTLLLPCAGNAQKWYTRDGNVSFYSDAPLEKIEAHNSKAMSVVDPESGAIEIAVLIKSFQFEKALMEEHFNENYMESEAYPKGFFKGTIQNIAEIDLTTDGTYQAKVSGDLTIHGVTNSIEVPAEIQVKKSVALAHSEFEIAVADYDIKIPKIVRDNVAKIVQVTIDIEYKPLDK